MFVYIYPGPVGPCARWVGREKDGSEQNGKCGPIPVKISFIVEVEWSFHIVFFLIELCSVPSLNDCLLRVRWPFCNNYTNHTLAMLYK